MKRTVLFSLLLCLGSVARAQVNGFRFIFPEYVRVVEGERMFSVGHFGAGFDHGFNDRLAYGLDLTFDLSRLVRDEFDDVLVDHNGITTSYYRKESSFSLLYRTSFALHNPDGTHFYLGTVLGYRSFRRTYTLSDPGVNSNGGNFENVVEGKANLFPLGIRFGLMGSLDGAFGDVYLQLGTVLGSAGAKLDQPYFQGSGFDPVGQLFTVGFAYGGGW